MTYDYLICGSGLFGSIAAYELRKAGYSVTVIEKRNHVGGNCYTENRDSINLHLFGIHIFHTNDLEIWQWINQFATFNDFKLQSVANYKGEIFSLPFSMWTFSQIYGVYSPEQVRAAINLESWWIKEPKNLEEQARKMVGLKAYEKLIKGYTEKQWRKPCNELPKEIIQRLPVRFTYDNNYFNDTYQGVPIGGYTQIFKKLLHGIDVQRNCDYFKHELPKHNKVIFTGAIDEFFAYKHGELEYKTTNFKHRHIDTENYQGCALMTYTDEETPHTRTIEHKHIEKATTPTTWVTWETPQEYKAGVTEPYYPVNDAVNNAKYQLYKSEAEKIKDKVLFGGRLAQYKYFDMHQVIAEALDFSQRLIQQ